VIPSVSVVELVGTFLLRTSQGMLHDHGRSLSLMNGSLATIRVVTPAVLDLQRAGVSFAVHEFDHHLAERSFGMAAARALNVEPDRVFKTLLANVTAADGAVTKAVAIVPVSAQLSMKELAAALGAKRAEMCPPAEAERITGYVVGGISPFGQKKQLPTVIDETCQLADSIFVSGGRRGLDLKLAPQALIAHLGAKVANIAVW
jgi:Cys-tRNA(Pro)/Cys-tRNA(Cys) deacylase